MRRHLILLGALAIAGLLLGASFALADDAPSAQEPPPMPGPGYCKENPGKCEAARARHEAWCKENPQKCEQMKAQRTQRREFCQQNPQQCEQQRAQMQQHRAEMKAKCAADPAKCEEMKQQMRARWQEHMGAGGTGGAAGQPAP